MTLKQAKYLYRFAGADAEHSVVEWQAVHAEIEAVVAAKSDRAGGNTIRWWGWNRYLTATIFARRVRREWTRMQKGKT